MLSVKVPDDDGIPPNMGLAVNDGGNCTVGNEGTGNIIVPAEELPVAFDMVKPIPVDVRPALA